MTESYRSKIIKALAKAPITKIETQPIELLSQIIDWRRSSAKYDIIGATSSSENSINAILSRILKKLEENNFYPGRDDVQFTAYIITCLETPLNQELPHIDYLNGIDVHESGRDHKTSKALDLLIADTNEKSFENSDIEKYIKELNDWLSTKGQNSNPKIQLKVKIEYV